MKKKVIITSLLIIAISVLAYTYAFPKRFSLKSINLKLNSKDAAIQKEVDWQFVEASLVEVSSKEKKAALEAAKILTILIGPPDTILDHSYYAYLTRYNEIEKIKADSDEIAEVLGDYQDMIVGAHYAMLHNSMKQLEDLNIESYSEIKYNSSIGDTGGNIYNICLEIIDAKYQVLSPKTGEAEWKKGNISVGISLILIENYYKIVNFNVYGISEDDEIEVSTEREISGLVGELKSDDSTEIDTEAIQATAAEIYNEYNKYVVSLMTINENNAVTSNSTGFFLKSGIIVANWSWFEKYLLSQEQLVISTRDGETYELDGVISISKYHDIIILKLKEETKLEPNYKIANYNRIKDLLMGYKQLMFLLTSPRGIGVASSVAYTKDFNGAFLEYMVNTELEIKTSAGEVGSPVFNDKGELVGIVNSKSIDSAFTSISSGLVQGLFPYFFAHINEFSFEEIPVLKIDKLKEKYYFDTLSEIAIENNDYNEKTYDKYMSLIDIKEVYPDSIASVSTVGNYLIVRVKHFENNLISKKQYTNLYTMKLIEAGFKETSSNEYRKIYKNDDYQVEIIYETGYLVFIYSEVES